MIINIVSIEKITPEHVQPRWMCWLELTEDDTALWLPATAPGELAVEDLQAHFDAQQVRLWQIAQEEEYEIDVIKRLPEHELLKRILRLILNEINILRNVAGLEPRTMAQLKQHLKNLI